MIDACCYEDYHSKLVTDALQGSQTLKHFIHCGNLRVYNPTVPRPWVEDGPRGRPCGFYSLQQQLMEARLLRLHKEASFPATVVLLGELVGEGWCPVTPQGLYDATCFDALTKPGGWIMIPEQRAVLQFLDVRDAVAAICAMYGLHPPSRLASVASAVGVPPFVAAFMSLAALSCCGAESVPSRAHPPLTSAVIQDREARCGGRPELEPLRLPRNRQGVRGGHRQPQWLERARNQGAQVARLFVCHRQVPARHEEACAHAACVSSEPGARRRSQPPTHMPGMGVVDVVRGNLE